MGTLALSTFKNQSKVFQGEWNILGKYSHVHLNTDGFQGHFHSEFFYTFKS